MKNPCEIVKLDRPEHSGDWHDAPIRYQVITPFGGIMNQKFSTKAEAKIWCVEAWRNAGDFKATSKAWDKRN